MSDASDSSSDLSLIFDEYLEWSKSQRKKDRSWAADCTIASSTG